MSTDWQTLRNTVIRETGDVPGPDLETELINRYQDNPHGVERAIEKILAAYRNGKIRSVWGALKTEIARALDPNNNPTHDHATTRQRAIQRAEQWIRAAGLHYDRQTEIVDELYGDRGILREFPDTQPRILQLWDELRPLGAIVEQEAEERGRRYIEQRAELAKSLRQIELAAQAEQKSIGNIEVKDGITVET